MVKAARNGGQELFDSLEAELPETEGELPETGVRVIVGDQGDRKQTQV